MHVYLTFITMLFSVIIPVYEFMHVHLCAWCYLELFVSEVTLSQSVHTAVLQRIPLVTMQKLCGPELYNSIKIFFLSFIKNTINLTNFLIVSNLSWFIHRKACVSVQQTGKSIVTYKEQPLIYQNVTTTCLWFEIQFILDI